MAEERPYEIRLLEDDALVMSFRNRTEALKFVLTHSPASINPMCLMHRTEEGEWIEIAQGAALNALARSERGAPPQHRVLIYSKPVRGREPENVVVDLIKRVLLQGHTELITIEVLRETEEGSDNWDNVLIATREVGDLYLLALRSYRTDRATIELDEDDAASGKEPA